MSWVHLLLPFLLSLTSAAGTNDDPAKCISHLLPAIDLAYPLTIPTIHPIAIPHYLKTSESQTIMIRDKVVKFKVPILKGFKSVDMPVRRMGRDLGILGKSTRDRYVLLEPFGESGSALEAEYRSYYCMMKLAQAGLAVPVLGITKIKGRSFVVRPLVHGYAPMALWGSLYGNSHFQQILDLENMQKILMNLYPGFVRWGIVNDSSWLTRESDADFGNEQLTFHFALELNRFLEQIKFAATDQGTLMVESLPAMVTDFARFSPYPIVHAEGLQTWRFERWNWYRYLLAAQMQENEKPKFYEWLKNKERVEWLMRFQFLGLVLKASPEFPGPRIKMVSSAKPFGMIEDQKVPFTRPANLRFKNNSSRRYHFEKHGMKMGYADADGYTQAAIDFAMAPPMENRLYFERKNGDIVLTESDGFRMVVFSADGLIRTFMQPSIEFHGHNYNSYYFYEQLLKDLDFLD